MPILNSMGKIISLLMLLFLAPTLWAQTEGYASWYGGKFHGRTTANGEIYDMNKLTAAHKTLPFGTVLKVTNLANSKTTIVRINDRGPFIPGRIIDLSRAAALEIDMIKDGVANVRLEIISEENKETNLENTDSKAEVFSIQVGAYSVKENAYSLREELEAIGLKVTFEATDKKIIRVLVINILPAELEAVKSKLKKAGYTDFLVKKS